MNMTQYKNKPRNRIILLTAALVLTTLSIFTVWQVFAVGNQNIYNFDFTGTMETFKVPKAGKYKIEAWGAEGGTDSHQGSGGKGGYTSGEVYLEAGEELFVTVGGFGDSIAQGYNGGGKAWTNVSGGSYGGGATDIRVGGTGYFNRILVAGGGGSSVRNYTGGYGGGVIGASGTGATGQFGTGASQSASGGGGLSGSFGAGASGGQSTGSTVDYGAGAGGGGWFGGGSASNYRNSTGSGAGGSGYVLTGDTIKDGIKINKSYRPTNYAPDAKYEFTNTELLSGNVSFFGPDGVREIGHSNSGYARITYFGENTQSSANLEGIRINGKVIDGFDPEVTEYTIPIASEYIAKDEITVDKRHNNQKIVGDGNVELKYHNLQHKVTVISADGTHTQEYTLNFQRSGSTKLYSLYSDEYTHAFTEAFKPNVYEYEFKSYLYGGINFKFQTFDSEASVKIEGAAEEELLPGENTIRITVSKPGLESTVYIIKATRNRDMEFSYTGNIQRFKVPYTGVYKFEAWGGEGGTDQKNGTGGKGGYAVGDVFLEAGTEMYVTVGGAGNATSRGYNGGGSAWTNVSGGSYGGGASDIRVGGTGLFNRILVAGGGGSSVRGYTGGAGGGLVGINGTGSTGQFGTGASQSASGGGGMSGNFGTGAGGGIGSGSSIDYGAGAGGGGWYGGGAAANYRNSTGSGAGGSGYVYSEKSYKPTNYRPSQKYMMHNDKLLDGTQSMPGHEGHTIEGNEGDGFVRISLLNKYSSDATLSSVTFSEGTFDVPFTPSIKNYNVAIDADTTKVKIAATTTDRNAVHNWDNDQEITIQPGTTAYPITVTGQDGTLNVYTFNVQRNPSNNADAYAISVNDVVLEGFKENIYDYVLELPYDADRAVAITATTNRPKQTITGLGDHIIENGKTLEINVTSEDGNKQNVYRITPKIEDSNRLKTLELDELTFEFNPEVFNYDVQIPNATVSLNITAIPFDHEATVSISGNGYLRKGKNTVLITVDEPNIGQQVYTLNVNRGDAGDGAQSIATDFVYTGKAQYFTAPYTGNYQLEAWGAEGGNRGGSSGGLGGYATGIVPLKKGEEVIIYVGGAGNSLARGWNGGASSGTSNVYGGGASDIRVESDSLFNRILVAGGGGSVGASNKPGGAGGGINGVSRTESYGSGGQGGTQSSAGNYASFGVGGAGSYYKDGRGGAGGGGWYGGGGVYPDYSRDDDRGGGGGSGYVYTDKSYKPSGYAPATRFMLKDTVLLSGNQNMPNKESGFTQGNKGNGFVRVTALKKASEDNHLSRLEVSKGTLSPTFVTEETDYTLQLGKDDTELTIKGIPMDPYASVSGNGTFDIPAGTSTFKIPVTAEDGTIRITTIKVNRDASENSLPKDVVINGLIPSLCGVSDEYCKLSPTFDPHNDLNSDGGHYTMIVPSRIRSLEFSVIKDHAYQVVTGEGVLELQPGPDNTQYIDVLSEDGSSYHAYTFAIDRDMTGNADFEAFALNAPKRDLEFNPDITEYYVSVPHEYTKFSEIDVHYQTMDPEAKVTILKDKDDLDLGLNKVIYRVTANNGETKDYTLNIYREDNANTFLKQLTVKHNDTILPLSPSFQKVISNYVVTVDNAIDFVEIEALAEAEETTVSGAGKHTLSVGSNVINIQTKAQDGTVQTYTLNVVRKQSSNSKIASLKISGVEMTEFSSDALRQTLSVTDTVVKPEIEVKLQSEFASYSITGNTSRFYPGDNTVNVRVTAEDGSISQYVITVTKPFATNNNLSSITSSMFEIEAFDPEVETYSVDVPYTEEALNLAATAQHPLTRVSGVGKVYLVPGDNTISIVATAENYEPKTYTVHVNMAKNSDPSLSSITTTPAATFDPSFDAQTTAYKINVGNEVETITVNASPKVTSTTIQGTGETQLEVGSNTITIQSTADSGASVAYVLNVVRDASTNADLETLIVHEGSLNRGFKPDVIEYDVMVPKGTSRINLETATQHPEAQVSVLGNEALKTGANKVTVRVHSEAKDTFKDYTLNVYVQDAPSETIHLSDLTVSSGKLIPGFSPDTQFYRVHVGNDIATFNVNAKTKTADVVLSGVGSHPLEVGNNLINIRATAKNNIIRDTQILVYRAPSSDATLSRLNVSGLKNNNINFKPNIFTYTGTTENTQLGISATPTHNKATVEIIGNHSFVFGTKNVVIVRVTAEDRITVEDYTLTINKEPSKNANLRSLTISGVRLNPSFSGNQTVYKANVGHDVTQVNVDAITSDLNATAQYGQVQTLNVGDNYVDINVASESGLRKTYTVVIHREGADDNTLTDVFVNDQHQEDFSNDVRSYTYRFPYEVETFKLDAHANHEKATVSGLKEYPLTVGENTIIMNVTAENGEVVTFKYSVTRDPINSAKLKQLKVQNYPFENGFDPARTHYMLTVDNEMTSLQMDFEKIDPKAKVVVRGNENFIEGRNVVEIEVTSSAKDKVETYVLEVYRQIYANNFLEYLSVDAELITPQFYKGIMEYRVEVPYDQETITFDGEATLSTSTVSGLEKFGLMYGENRFVITVSSRTKIERKYHVVVNRAHSNDNQLTDLSIQLKGENMAYSPTFDPQTDVYTVNEEVPVGTESINISATSKTATVTGDGQQKLHVGENRLPIVVTSDSGIQKTYTVVVNRPASTNNALTNITPSNGSLIPNFNYTKDVYNLTTESTTNYLSFNVNTEDRNAKVTGHTRQLLEPGKNVREIVVTAENGETKTYTINVTRPQTDETRLKKLAVTGYEFEENFDASIFTYHLKVPNSKKVLYASDIKFETVDPNARVETSGDLVLSTTNENIYELRVRAVDGYTIETYRILIDRSSGNDSTIKELQFESGTLNRSFNPNVFTYDLEMSGDVKTFDHTYIKKLVTADDKAVVSYEPKEAINLEVGTVKPFKIKVTSEDGTTSTTYTFNVTYVRSRNNKLSSIEVDGSIFKIPFNPDVSEYEVGVEAGTTSVVIRAFTQDPKAKILSSIGDRELIGDATKVTIGVEAENGDVRNYTLIIKRNLSRTLDLEDVTLTDSQNGALDPSYNNAAIQFEGQVARETDRVGLVVKKGHESQTINVYDRFNNPLDINNIPLKIGRNDIQVEVVSPFGTSRIFNIKIMRAGSDDASLKSLKITNPSIELPFESDVTTYRTTVASEFDKLGIEAETTDPKARYEVLNNDYLTEGNNDVIVRGIAENGETKDYVIHVLREPRYNNYLQTITVSEDGVIISKGEDFSPKFNRAMMNYTVKVSSATDKVLVQGVPQVETTLVAGSSPNDTGNKATNGVEVKLKPGMNTVKLMATEAQEGNVAIYTISIFKEMSDDASLIGLIPFRETPSGPENLNFNEGSFDPQKQHYSISVGEHDSKLGINATPVSPNARVVIRGNDPLLNGKNMVTIVVTSEDRTKTKTYYVSVDKKLSNDTSLASLSAEHGDISHTFDLTEKNLSYTVDMGVDHINLKATSMDPLANVEGIGEYALDFGANVFDISVTAQNGDIEKRTVTIHRAYDNRMQTIQLSHGELMPQFDMETTEYTVWVPENVERISVKGVALNRPVAKVTGGGWIDLALGENSIPLTVASPDGSSRIYTVKVMRSASYNNYLSALALSEGLLSPEFDKNRTDYTTYISDIHDVVTLTVTPEDAKATYEVLGYPSVQDDEGNLVVSGVKHGENHLTIRVTAENGDARDYTLNVIQQESSMFSNRLKSLSVTPSKGIAPSFKPDTTRYVVNVDTSTTEVTIDATKESDDATIISGLGTFPVASGRNSYKVVVQSKDGLLRTYEIIINQALSGDATLSKLSFEEGLLTPIFSKGRKEYALYVANGVSTLTPSITPSALGTKWVITGNGIDAPLGDDNNTVTITTTAANGKSTDTYTVKVYKSSQSSIYLDAITANVGTFKEPFDKTNGGPYTLMVDPNVKSVMIGAKPEDEHAIASIEGVGIVDVSDSAGKNVDIVVTGKSGASMTYTVKIVKAPRNNARLSFMAIQPGKLEPQFSPLRSAYVANISHEQERVEISAKSEDPEAIISGAGIKEVAVGLNEFDVVVTSSNGDVGIYDVDITREAEISSKATLIRFKEALIENPNFDKEIENYALTVPNEVTKLNLDTVILEDPTRSTYEIFGNTNLKVGDNTVKVVVKNSENIPDTVYVFTVNRQIFSSNFLKNLTTNKGHVSPSFDKYINNYDITVPFEVHEMDLIATPEDAKSMISGTGTVRDLEVGVNVHKIVVTSSENVSRTYIVRINRLPNSDNTLHELIVEGGTLGQPFDPQNIGPYVVTVAEGRATVEFKTVLPEGATVVGDGIVEISAGETKHRITVTSQDGNERHYEFVIKRPVAHDASITNIIPQTGVLSPNFAADIRTYYVTVPDSIMEMGFDVETSNAQTTVTGHEVRTIPYGETSFTVVATAENGITQESYTIVVVRERDIRSIDVESATLILNVGEVKGIKATVNPEDATHQGLVWKVSDPEVLSIDQSGVVTALKPGGAMIEISSEKNPGIKTRIGVTVMNLTLSSDSLDVKRIDAMESPVETLKDFVVGSEPSTTVESYKQMFINEQDALKVYDKNGIELTDDSQLVGTGMVLKLEYGETVYDQLVIVVMGDANGDGIVNVLDEGDIMNSILKIVTFDDYQGIAANINHDEVVNVLDQGYITNYILKKISTLNGIGG